MSKSVNNQDIILSNARASKEQVTVFIVNGFQLHGIVTGYDRYTVTLTSGSKHQLIYKHAISTIVVAGSVDTSQTEGGSDVL